MAGEQWWDAAPTHEPRYMLIVESQYARVLIPDHAWHYVVEVKRTKGEITFATEAAAMQHYEAINHIEQLHYDDLNQKDQAEKEQAGYGEW